MKRLVLFLCLFFVLLMPQVSNALDFVSETKDWEYSLSFGYKMHTEKDVDDAFAAGFRAQRRVAYPVLVGIGTEASYFQDIIYCEINAPVTYRIGLGPIKADAMVIPGGAYAYNFENKNDKLMGTVTAGLEIKKFIQKGKSIGLGVFYTMCTYNELNNFKFSFVFGF